MADTWTCTNCKQELRCSCQSQECAFEYDIRAHLRHDLTKAVSAALNWIEPNAVMNVTERAIQDNEEPCCQACVDNR